MVNIGVIMSLARFNLKAVCIYMALVVLLQRSPVAASKMAPSVSTGVSTDKLDISSASHSHVSTAKSSQSKPTKGGNSNNQRACEILWNCDGQWIAGTTIEPDWAPAVAADIASNMFTTPNLFDLEGFKWALFFGDSNTRMLHTAIFTELCTRPKYQCVILFPYSPPVVKPVGQSYLPSKFKNNYKNDIKEDLGVFNEDHDVLITRERPTLDGSKSTISTGHLRLSFRMYAGDPDMMARSMADFNKLFCFGITPADRPARCGAGKEIELISQNVSIASLLPPQWHTTTVPHTIFAADTLWKLFGNRLMNESILIAQFQTLRQLNARHTHVKIVWLPFYNLRWTILEHTNGVKFVDFTVNRTVPAVEYLDWIPNANRIRLQLSVQSGFRIFNLTQIADRYDEYILKAHPRLYMHPINEGKLNTLRHSVSPDGIHQRPSFYNEVARYVLHTYRYCDDSHAKLTALT